MAREIGVAIANFFVAEAVTAFYVLGTAWPSLRTQTEVAESVMLVAIAVVPVGFLMIYPAFRLATRSLYRSHAVFVDVAGPWLPGVVVTAVLAVAGRLIEVLPNLLGG